MTGDRIAGARMAKERHETRLALACDMCGKALLVDEDVRYVVKIEVYAAYDPMELTQQDLEKDRRRELEALLEKARNMSEEELQDSVYRELEFHLCPACQRRYLKNPLGTEGTGES